MAKQSDQRSNSLLTASAIYGNSTKSIDPWVRSTGFRTHGLRYRTLGDPVHTRIAEDFLINTRLLRHDRETEASVQPYFSDPGVTMLSMVGYEERAGSRELKLPQGVKLQIGLGEAIGRRRSVRSYTGDVMDFDYLAALIQSAMGVTCYATVDLMGAGEATLRFRAAPSGGGVYPIDLYLASLKVKGLDIGIYRYNPLKDTLIHLGEPSDVDNLLRSFGVSDDQISLSRANAVFLLVGHPWRSMRKYGNRGLRFLFIEAGTITENMHLATTALGFGSVDCASVYDDEVHEALNLDGLYQTLLHTVIVGYPG